MKIGRIVSRIILILLIGLMLGLCIYSVNAKLLLQDPLPMPFGIGTSVVLSGSMEPELSVNDLVIIQKQDAYETGDVVVYQTGRNHLVIHRIVEINDEFAVTKGDANNVEDDPINISQIRGKLIKSIPGVGNIVKILKSISGRVSILLIAILLFERSWRKEKIEQEEDRQKILREIKKLQQELAEEE